MGDEELLRTSGLILTSPETQQEGITLAAILLFGKDSTIMSAIPQHKTDAIFRVFDLDRYDDRNVIMTNLLESYDQLMTFGQKHLNDPFVLVGIQSVSARDKILREVISNSLAHRDYASGYIAKMVIEKNQIYTENSNRTHGYGSLSLETFKPFPKNPPISKVFREIGFADELGSGMRNTYKYTLLYSGGTPIFEEKDIFTTVIPLNATATATVGPSAEVSAEVKLKEECILLLLKYCNVPRTRKEMQQFCDIKSDEYFRKGVVRPLLQHGLIVQTIPEKPQSSKQRYITSSSFAHE